jgi:hypothetical protein
MLLTKRAGCNPSSAAFASMCLHIRAHEILSECRDYKAQKAALPLLLHSA